MSNVFLNDSARAVMRGKINNRLYELKPPLPVCSVEIPGHRRLDCKTCHTNISTYPHPKNTAQNSRDYTLQYKDTCKQCHASESQALGDSIHTKMLNEGNKNSPVCSDCHNAHNQPPVKKTAQGAPAPEEHANIARICARCHNTEFQQMDGSHHAKAGDILASLDNLLGEV
ncbi:MAG: hypothetical protein HGA93_00570, partial [Methanothrix sp.]|nr:hypothetical protein [Methanothrix sp.]